MKHQKVHFHFAQMINKQIGRLTTHMGSTRFGILSDPTIEAYCNYIFLFQYCLDRLTPLHKRPFQLTKMPKERDFNANFWEFFFLGGRGGGIAPDPHSGKGLTAPIPRPNSRGGTQTVKCLEHHDILIRICLNKFHTGHDKKCFYSRPSGVCRYGRLLWNARVFLFFFI